MSLRSKLVLGLLLLLLVGLGRMNLYQCRAESNSTRMVFSGSEPVSDWSPVWIVPLDSGQDRASGLMAAALLEQFAASGVEAVMAPPAAVIAEGEPVPTLLFLSVGEWRSDLQLFGRQITASVKLLSQSLNRGCMDCYGDGLTIAQRMETTARFTGLVHDGAADRAMAKTVAEQLVTGVTDELQRRGFAFRPVTSDKTGGFSWSFRLKLPAWLQGNARLASVDDTKLLGSSPAYAWTVPGAAGAQRVRVYRVRATGGDLEAALLDRFPSAADGQGFSDLFVNGMNRRIVGEGELAHWCAEVEARPVNGSGDESPAYADLQDQLLTRYAMAFDNE